MITTLRITVEKRLNLVKMKFLLTNHLKFKFLLNNNIIVTIFRNTSQ